MRPIVAQMRALLSQLEREAERVDEAAVFHALSGLELPDIICDVVDLLLPELKPYEASFYFYFLRHSIIANGAPYIRVSRARYNRALLSRPMREARLAAKLLKAGS